MQNSIFQTVDSHPGSNPNTVRNRLDWTTAALLLFSVAGWLAGCTATPKSNQEIRQQAAQDTAKAKQAAKDAAAEARVAAGKAENVVSNVAAGVKQGLTSNTKPSAATPVLDLNSASAAQLSTLPGITHATARAIVNARPFGTPHDLVDRSIVPESEYDRISDRVTAN